MEKKPDFSPPGWIVSWFNDVRLDPERAEKFHQFRQRICQRLGQDNEACQVNNLWMQALDLLLASETTDDRS